METEEKTSVEVIHYKKKQTITKTKQTTGSLVLLGTGPGRDWNVVPELSRFSKLKFRLVARRKGGRGFRNNKKKNNQVLNALQLSRERERKTNTHRHSHRHTEEEQTLNSSLNSKIKQERRPKWKKATNKMQHNTKKKKNCQPTLKQQINPVNQLKLHN